MENNDFLLRKSGIVGRKTMKNAWICIVESIKKEENKNVKEIEKGFVLWFKSASFLSNEVLSRAEKWGKRAWE